MAVVILLTTTLSKLSSHERLGEVDLEPKSLKATFDRRSHIRRDDDIVPKDTHLTRVG
jgi:hypothetical protein